jgi:hypothetical protein
MSEVVTSIKTWVQRQNYIKNLKEIHHPSSGFVLKTLAYLGLLIYWAIMILAGFSLLN